MTSFTPAIRATDRPRLSPTERLIARLGVALERWARQRAYDRHAARLTHRRAEALVTREREEQANAFALWFQAR